MFKNKFLQVLILSFTVCSAYGQNFEQQLDSLFNEYSGKPGCAVGIFSKGEIIFQKGYGYANLDYDIKITPQTVFDIGSTSKQFTAACIALLEEQGKINFNEPIHKYLPELPDYKKGKVSIYNLLHHTSGLKDYLNYIYPSGKTEDDYFTEETGLNILSRLNELDFAPGTKFQYSNSNYLALAVIVRRVTGMSIGEFAKKNIFEPLRMDNTFIYENPYRVIKNRAIGYSVKDGNYIRNHHYDFALGGDGQVYTTVQDFFGWNENFKTHQVGGKEFNTKMLTRGVLNNGDSIDYALGLNVSEFKGLKTISHTGSWGGFLSYYLRFPQEDFSVIILSNNGSFDLFVNPHKIAEIYLKDKLEESHSNPNKKQLIDFKLKKISNKQLKKHEGLYWNYNQSFSRRVYLKNDTLRFYRSKNSEYNLYPINKSEFIMDENGAFINVKFVNDDKGSKQLQMFLDERKVNEYEFYEAADYSAKELKNFIGSYINTELDVRYDLKLEHDDITVYINGIKYTTLDPIMENFFSSEVGGFKFSSEKNAFEFRELLFVKE